MKDLKKYIIRGIIFVSLLGTLFHFAYNLSGSNALVGLFAPVNESIWEHTKLIFFPMLIYSIYLNKKIGAQYPCVNSAMAFASLLGVVLIIGLYYTYSGIIGFNIAFVDILIFYISTITAFFAAYKASISCKVHKHYTILWSLQIVLICLFVIFTFFPPNIPLFINP